MTPFEAAALQRGSFQACVTHLISSHVGCSGVSSWHVHVQLVQRRSLRSIMPNAKAVFENLFKQLDIEEPAFKNVVVLYRRKVSDKPQRKSEYEPIRDHNLVSHLQGLVLRQSPHTGG